MLSEFILIVVGVLVALAINTWSSSRQRDKAEVIALQSIRSALADDLKLLLDADVEYRAREKHITTLLQYLNDNRAYNDSMRADFGAVYGFAIISLNRAPYEALRATDLALISDDSLRGQIVDVYERTYGNLIDAEETERNATFEVFRPYFLREFHDLQFRDSATPWNYDAITHDRYFRNIVEYRLAVLRSNPIQTTTAAIPAIKLLIKNIDSALTNQ